MNPGGRRKNSKKELHAVVKIFKMLDQTDIIGTFEIETSFTITGRGFVALGRVIDGRVKLGSTTKILVQGTVITVKITGIDHGKLDAEGIIKWGLFFHIEDQRIREYAKRNRLEKQIIHLHPPEDNQ